MLIQLTAAVYFRRAESGTVSCTRFVDGVTLPAAKIGARAVIFIDNDAYSFVAYFVVTTCPRNAYGRRARFKRFPIAVR
jgi:hypothetical protein